MNRDFVDYTCRNIELLKNTVNLSQRSLNRQRRRVKLSSIATNILVVAVITEGLRIKDLSNRTRKMEKELKELKGV